MKDNGGSAFPSHGSMGEVAQEGISARDYFAAKAMQAFILESIPEIIVPSGQFEGKTEAMVDAMRAYVMADAMIAERSKE